MRIPSVTLLFWFALLTSCQRRDFRSTPSGTVPASNPVTVSIAQREVRPYAAQIKETVMLRHQQVPTSLVAEPSAVRSYPEAKRLPLPRPTPRIGVTLEQALHRAPLSIAQADPTRQEIADLLFYGYGETGGQGGLRAAASAGALYPTDVFLSVRRANGFPTGTYYYDPSRHELVVLAKTPEPGATDAAISLVLGVNYARSAAKYGARAPRYGALDAGHVLTNLQLVAATRGLDCHWVERLDIEALRASLSLTSASEGILAGFDCERSKSSLGTPPKAWSTLEASDLFETISQRRSHRHFVDRPIAQVMVTEFLGAIVEAGTFVAPSKMVELWLLVRAVTQLEPGLYRYAPAHGRLQLARRGDLSDALAKAGLDQAMLAEAAFVVALTVAQPFPETHASDQAFKLTCLQAGAMGEMGYLLATAQHLRVCGVGAFFDDELNRLFGDSPRDGLYLLAVGEQ